MDVVSTSLDSGAGREVPAAKFLHLDVPDLTTVQLVYVRRSEREQYTHLRLK